MLSKSLKNPKLGRQKRRLNLHPHPRPYFPFFVWFLSSLFIVYKLLLIASPSIMFAELEATLNIEASEVGTIAAWSLYPLLLFQIPFGILIDKFGPRRITSAAVLSKALGCLIFAMSYNTVTACFGRFLIGMGSAAAFPYVVKIISNWFKPKYFAIFLGATISLGMLGILAGEILLSSHILHYGWRLSMIHFSILGFILSGFYFFTIRDKDPSVRYDMNPKDRNFDFKKSFKKLLKNKQTWILTIYTAFAKPPCLFS